MDGLIFEHMLVITEYHLIFSFVFHLLALKDTKTLQRGLANTIDLGFKHQIN